MEVKGAAAPQLVVINELPHADLSVGGSSFFAQVVAHDLDDFGFHGFVGVAGLGPVSHWSAVRADGIRLAIGTQIAAQETNHTLPVLATVGVRDVRQCVDTLDTHERLVGAQLTDGIMHLRADKTVLLAFFSVLGALLLMLRALLISLGLLTFLVLDYQIGDRAHASDEGQGDFDDAFRLRLGIQ